MQSCQINALIVGGGIAGLWALDALRRNGFSTILVESNALGSGQTGASQGILHSGLKYSLSGVLTAAAREARDMPQLWRRCLAGQTAPDLRAASVSAESFYLWGTQAASSRIGLLGAQIGLKVAPRSVPRSERPAILSHCPGAVFQVDEQVVSPTSLVGALAALNRDALLLSDSVAGIEFSPPGAGRRCGNVLVHSPTRRRSIEFNPDVVILAAGRGNGPLRRTLGLPPHIMQLRPLHYVLVRGASLPEFHGHCVDWNRTRVSITSARDRNGVVVWQVGGEISEVGVQMDSDRLIRHTQAELRAVLPGFDFDSLVWTTCRIDRAEGAIAGGGRPDSFRIIREDDVLTVWPTKLVLVPQLAQELLKLCQAEMKPRPLTAEHRNALDGWPRPEVVRPKWDQSIAWSQIDEPPYGVRRAA